MALSERLAQPTEAIHGYPCSVGALLATLKGDELEAFKVMLGDPVKRDGWTASAIYDAVTAEGHKVAWSQINKHRGGRCRCAKDAA